MLARLRAVYDKQLAWHRKIFKEIGFVGDDLETRVRLFVCYFTWERIMFPGLSKARAKKLIEHQVALLIRP